MGISKKKKRKRIFCYNKSIIDVDIEESSQFNFLFVDVPCNLYLNSIAFYTVAENEAPSFSCTTIN